MLVRGAYEAGSCPILSWKSAKHEQWDKFGRILVDAVTSHRKMTASIPVDPSANEFRLSEEENEITFIENIQMSAVDQWGRTHTLTPDRHFPTTNSQGYIVLNPNTSIHFGFTIPESLGTLHDKKLHITGFYIPRSLVTK